MIARLPKLKPTRFRVLDVLVLAATAAVVLQAPLSVVETVANPGSKLPPLRRICAVSSKPCAYVAPPEDAAAAAGFTSGSKVHERGSNGVVARAPGGAR